MQAPGQEPLAHRLGFAEAQLAGGTIIPGGVQGDEHPTADELEELGDPGVPVAVLD